MASKSPRKPDGFDLSQTPSHLFRRCTQYANDLFAQELAASGLTKTQFTVLAAVDQHDGVSQTDLVGITKVDRSTLAEMLNRMCDKDLLDRQRTEDDARANSVRITADGKKALRAGRAAAERVERNLLNMLGVTDRTRLVKLLSTVVAAAETADPKARRARRKGAR